MAKVCSFEGCGRKAVSLGHCYGHARQRKLGIPLATLRYRSKRGQSRQCSATGCEMPAKWSGMCIMHKHRLDRGLDMDAPAARSGLRLSWLGRFFSQVHIPEDPDGCWIWHGYRTSAGYGMIHVDGRQVPAHRLSWEIQNRRPLETGLYACHRCDNPPCVNPGHIFAGTPSDNVQDMISKGRQGKFSPGGEKNPNSKLTETDVVEIRNRAKNGERGTCIAMDYGLSKTLVSKIVRRNAWKHVP